MQASTSDVHIESVPTPSDGALAQRWAEGDRAAGAMLVERHQAVVRAFLRRLVPRADWADDLAQETFLRLLRHADRYDPKYPMRTWLLTIARRLFLNHAQLAVHRPSDAQVDALVTRDTSHELHVEVQDEQAHQRVMIDQALARLSEPQRTALVLFYQQDQSVEQIAQVMEVPQGTVKSHLSRGRIAMRHLLLQTKGGAL